MNFRFFLEKGNSLSLSLSMSSALFSLSRILAISSSSLSHCLSSHLMRAMEIFSSRASPSSPSPLLLLSSPSPFLSLLSLSFSRRRGKPLRLSSQRKLVPLRGNREENFSPTFSLSLSFSSFSLPLSTIPLATEIASVVRRGGRRKVFLSPLSLFLFPTLLVFSPLTFSLSLSHADNCLLLLSLPSPSLSFLNALLSSQFPLSLSTLSPSLLLLSPLYSSPARLSLSRCISLSLSSSLLTTEMASIARRTPPLSRALLSPSPSLSRRKFFRREEFSLLFFPFSLFAGLACQTRS